MCRLFGLSAAPHRVKAEFWLLEAPDSLSQQSHRNPDGTGIGFFDADGRTVLDKEPLPAFEDAAFAREAKRETSAIFISHIRHATTGTRSVQNCHPFAMDGRIFAHNGAFDGLPELEAQLGDVRSLVLGETDSERYFALITRKIRERDGHVKAGLVAAASWIAEHLPVCSLNCLIATRSELWALRYPETDPLYMLEREPGGRHRRKELHYVSSRSRIRSSDLAEKPSVVFASEPLDDHPDWRAVRSGELIHVAPDLTVRSSIELTKPPAKPWMVQRNPTG